MLMLGIRSCAVREVVGLWIQRSDEVLPAVFGRREQQGIFRQLQADVRPWSIGCGRLEEGRAQDWFLAVPCASPWDDRAGR